MLIDVSLCVEYLHMPEAHWALAVETDAWVHTDVLATGLAGTALYALAQGDDETAGTAALALKKHVMRVKPELTEGVYPMLLAVALPQTLATLRAKGVPEEIARDTVSDYAIWARSYEKQTGKAGFGEIFWELGFHSGRLIKLGRLQFETCTFHAPYTIYRHRKTGALIPAIHEGEGIDAHGYLAEDRPAVFKTRLEVKDGTLYCNRVDTDLAKVLDEQAAYALEELEPILTEGAQALGVHIPETGPLSADEVTAALQQAKEYFAAKGYPCRAAVCESWLLDPALKVYGQGCGNITAFQERFALYPWPTEASDAVSRVFGRGTDASNPDVLPEDTRLQRGLKAYLKTGMPLRDAGGVLLL